jgi:hypothetical protein
LKYISVRHRDHNWLKSISDSDIAVHHRHYQSSSTCC